MYEAHILMWAAGSTRDMPRIEKNLIDESRLLEAVREHRIAELFLSRIDQNKPEWCTKSIYDALIEQRQEAYGNLKRRVEAINQICDLLPSGERLPIVIKGFSIYALTANRHSIRISSDVDLFADKPQLLVELLSSLGYIETKPPAPHECANMYSNDVPLDIHKYFPVWNYPGLKDIEYLAPASHPGRWSQNIDISTRMIQYDDLFACALKSKTTTTIGVMVPNPVMSTLLLCAHAFKDYAEWWFATPTLRLGLLADVRELIQHRDFDKQQFGALVDRFSGHAAIEYVGYALDVYFGSVATDTTSLACRLAHAPTNHFRFPRRLWHGFWVTIDWPIEDLLLRSVNMNTIVSQLQANTIFSNSQDSTKLYTTVQDRAGVVLQRVIVQEANASEIPIEVSVTWSEVSLSFEISVLESIHYYVDRVRLDFGDKISELVYDGTHGSTAIEGIGDLTSFQSYETGYSIILTLTWDALGLSPDSSEIPMWLGVVRQKSVWDVVAGTLLPLYLKKGY